MQPSREKFSSKFLTIIVMVGAAVGLGNVWRFPYMMGANGGGTFLLFYIIFTALIAIPAMTGELTLGRNTRSGSIKAFETAMGNRLGQYIGWLMVACYMISSSAYLVILGNLLYASIFAGTTGFNACSTPEYEPSLANGWMQYTFAVTVLLGTLFIVYLGVVKGIERVSKIIVPLFSAVLLYLVVYTFLLEGATDYMVEFLKPDWSKVNSDLIFAALGQAFFSLGLGGTIMVIYGSYMSKEENIINTATSTALFDGGAALMATFFIVPTVLIFGLNMSQGPTLLFYTLPQAFAVLPGGRIIGAVFLLALFLVAFLSIVATVEAVVGSISERLKGENSRKKIILALLIVEVPMIIPSAHDPDFIGKVDLYFGSGMQIFGSGLAVLVITRFLSKFDFLHEVFGSVTMKCHQHYYLWIRTAVPITIFIVLATYLWSQFTA
ncbi:sodium-dependent transporter [Emcibacteraceae bacterium]|nr:sodium-dependent transporter [Emcibacteraceae bacterium]